MIDGVEWCGGGEPGYAVLTVSRAGVILFCVLARVVGVCRALTPCAKQAMRRRFCCWAALIFVRDLRNAKHRELLSEQRLKCLAPLASIGWVLAIILPLTAPEENTGYDY